MTEISGLEAFVEVVLRNLEKNGFPLNPVSFPLEKMYETASLRGFSFNKVRDSLRERGIDTELDGERVVFSQKAPSPDEADLEKMSAVAEQILQNMSPEQQAQITRMMQDMSPETLAMMREQWETIPSTEKTRMMEDITKKNDPSQTK